MKIRYFLVIFFVLCGLSCNAVTRIFSKPTATPRPTMTVSTATDVEPTATAVDTGLYIPPSCAGKPVATIPPATMFAKPTSALSTNPKLSKDEQLRVFDELTADIKKVYLYPDYNGLDWPKTVSDYRKKINDGLDTETFYIDMEKLMISLNDDHSSFLSPVDVAASKAELDGKIDYVGIGVLIHPMPDKGKITLLSVLPGSSAEHGGLKEHDSILSVDGEPIIQKGEDYSLKVRGPECSAVTLRVQSPGGEPHDQTFMRFRITSTLPIVARLVKTTDGSRIGYIFLPSFFDDTIPGQVKQALEDFGHLDGLVIDNRMNGGGSSGVVYPIFSYFTSGTLGHFVLRDSQDALDIQADPVENSQDVPMVILVGEGTASFGEIFSGVMRDIGRAKIVGKTTDGNVETLEGFNFSDGSQAWIAAERFQPLHTKDDWEKTGIVPDVTAYADWDTFTFETDPSIAAALKLLGHK